MIAAFVVIKWILVVVMVAARMDRIPFISEFAIRHDVGQSVVSLSGNANGRDGIRRVRFQAGLHRRDLYKG